MKERKSLYSSISGWGIFLAGVLLFTACADDEIIESPAVTGDGISFSISKTKKTWEPDQTRSAKSKGNPTFRCEDPNGDFSIDVTITDGIDSYEPDQQPQSRGTQITEKNENWGYKVGAYYYIPNQTTPMDYFDENSSGGYSVATSTETVNTDYYWPPAGSMKFFAVAPANITGLNVPTAANIATPTLTYTIPSEVTNQKDIMVAQSTIDCNANNGTVGLQFEHLLAAVQFKMGDMLATQVNSIVIKGIKGGAIKFEYIDGKWSPTSYGLANTSYSLSLESNTLTNTLNTDEGADISGNGTNSMLLLAPQTVSKLSITVNYTEILVKDGETTEKTIDLENLTFEAGKTYAFTLNINSNLTIEIPKPEDQDAHFVMVNLAYDLSKIPNTVTNLEVSVTDFEYENEEDEDNHSTNEDAFVIKYKDRSETHKRGFWAKKDIFTEYEYNNKGELTNTPTPTDVIHLSDQNQSLSLGYDNAELKSDNSIMLFLGENNSIYNRDIVLRITGKYNDETITIGSGRFTQLCPSWNGKQYGCERIENIVEDENRNKVIETQPYGFYWDKKATYTLASGLEALIGAFSRAAFQNILKINLDEDTDKTTVGIHGNANTDFLSYEIKEYKGLLINFKYISSVTFNYNVLSTLTGLTTANNGLQNTLNLFNLVGGVNINDVEEDLDNLAADYTINLLYNEIKLIEHSKTGTHKDVKTDYAAAETLKCNEVIGNITKTTVGSTDPIYNYGFTLVGGTANWYLPSSDEAKNLSDPVYPLNGTYWSSTAGTDPTPTTKGYAYSYTYSDNSYKSYNPSEERTTSLKVRAVRKKP